MTRLILRRASRKIWIRDVALGGDAPIVVQTMTKTDTRDISATLGEIQRLADVGCEVVRLAVPDHEAAAALKTICEKSPIPVVADIHFNYLLALEAADNGVHALRINPGNLAKKDYIKAVVAKAKERNLSIRVGVNSGSVEKPVQEQHPDDLTAQLVESALLNVRLLEEEEFFDIEISVKASDPMTMVEAYRRVAAATPYALHLGVTEAGTLKRGIIKSAVGMGILLAEGIGDTIRVSLTADPVEEVTAGFEILKAVGIRQESADLVSCPSCGRAEVDLHGLANKVEALIASIKLPIRVAVMGCFVNGPGEASHADIGIAGAMSQFYIFRGMDILHKVPEEAAFDLFKQEIERFIDENREMLAARMASGERPLLKV